MPKYEITPRISFVSELAYNRPDAMAWVTGNASNPQISGLVKFYQTSTGGVLIEAEVFGLPNVQTPDSSDFYALHIHEFGNCRGNFDSAGEHYNPENAPHPDHAGDLPPLLSNQGYAWSSFYDKRFTIEEIIGKSIIIHSGTDDFKSQPAGNSGVRIACGEIKRL